MTTPDVQIDLMEILAAQTSLATHVIITGATRNTWPGIPKPSKDAGTPQNSVWILYVSTSYDHDNDKNFRVFTVQAIVRGSKNGEAATGVRTRAIHDAAGSAVGGALYEVTATTSGVRYKAIIPVGITDLGPDPSSDAPMQAVDFEMWFDG